MSITEKTKTVKEQARELIERLPDDVTWDELQCRIHTRSTLESGVDDDEYLRETIEESMRELEAGQGISHEDIKKRLAKWLV